MRSRAGFIVVYITAGSETGKCRRIIYTDGSGKHDRDSTAATD